MGMSAHLDTNKTNKWTRQKMRKNILGKVGEKELQWITKVLIKEIRANRNEQKFATEVRHF